MNKKDILLCATIFIVANAVALTFLSQWQDHVSVKFLPDTGLFISSRKAGGLILLNVFLLIIVLKFVIKESK